MSNIARRSEEWHLNRDWVVILVTAAILVVVKLGLAVPWEHALPDAVHTGAQFNSKMALAGLLVGFLVGLTGMGSGALMAPVLIFLLHIQPTMAIGSDLVYASITKVFGAFQHYKHGTVDLRLTRWLATGSIPGAIIGSVSVHWLQTAYGDSVQHITLKLLGGTFVLVSAAMLLKTMIRHREHTATRMGSFSLRRKLGTIVLGLGAGILVGLTSVGAGSLLMTMFILFYPVSTTTLVGTDVFHAVMLTGVAGFSHFLEGNVDLVLVANLLIGSIPGIVIGSHLVKRAPERALRASLAIVLLLTGLKMWLK